MNKEELQARIREIIEEIGSQYTIKDSLEEDLCGTILELEGLGMELKECYLMLERCYG